MFECENDLLTRKDVQRLLSLGKNTILNFIHNGYLPSVMIAGRYRIKKEDLIEFVEKSNIF